jgi:hypothetical protein
MPLLKRVRVLAAKHETTLGTAISVGTADATFNAYDIDIQGNLEFNERMQQGSMSMLSGTIGKRPGTLSFKTGLSGNGAAASPGWLDTLLPAVGMIEATDTFSPTSTAPATTSGTGVAHTVTIAVYENGVKKSLAGAMGNLKINATAGQHVELEWTFTGVWQAVTDETILAPTYDTVLPLKFMGATMTIGGSSAGCVNTLSIDLGNTVKLLECATSASGLSYSVITDRKVVGTWDPESRLVATEDVYGAWLAGTEQAFSLALTDETDTVTIAAPQAQRTNVQEGEREGIQVDNITWNANSNSAAGDDELTIDFS